ncbi:MAG: hypothetical protein ABSE63_15710 [Thermoguttaceae bacterium]|jgi:predicted RNase H-like nuclease (RuvC/YqgF family)
MTPEQVEKEIQKLKDEIVRLDRKITDNVSNFTSQIDALVSNDLELGRKISNSIMELKNQISEGRRAPP